jgi:hypothetical protein
MSRPDSDSPNKLENGRWTLRGRVLVWEAWGPEPVPPLVPGLPTNACRDCAADFATARHGGRGLCKRCYRRHYKAGTVTQFPLVGAA